MAYCSADLVLTKDHVILKKDSASLWCSKTDGNLLPGKDVDYSCLDSPINAGKVWGCIGKIRFFVDGEWKLVLITHASSVGNLPHGGEAFCVDRVAVIPLTTDTSREIIGIEVKGNVFGAGGAKDKSKELKEREKLERRLTEALLWMFTDSQSFYFCMDTDLTKSVQRQFAGSEEVLKEVPLWQKVDDRFFWNRWMISDLLDESYVGEFADPWILPVIQGCVEVRQVPIISYHNPIQVLVEEAKEDHFAGDLKHRNWQTTMEFEMETLSGVSGYGYESDNESNYTSDKEDSSAFVDDTAEIAENQELFISEEEASRQELQMFGGTSHEHVPTDNISEHLNDVEHSPRTSQSELKPEHKISLGTSPFEDSVLYVDDLIESTEPKSTLTLAIISRRSRYRAGTRYRRRGIDSNGHVANYVETEVIMKYRSFVVAYTIVRGSVPVYWTQPGYKYRPPPVIENDEEETMEALKKHILQQINFYNELALVNLVKQSGREKPLADIYKDSVMKLNNPLVTYIDFDFHQHFKNNQSRGMKQFLMRTSGLIKRFKFLWFDTEQPIGPLCIQEGVFRVNCMDCLDRTNVIESILANEVLQAALQKLGVISFEDRLSGPMLSSFQEMWANNGDLVSRQYTGTAAMKGDITRYGERKFTGLMKDGYNSAHRYYMNVFRDTYRQVLIDLMQGCDITSAFAALPHSLKMTDELDDGLTIPCTDSLTHDDVGQTLWSLDREEVVTDIVQRCKKDLFPESYAHVQGWALVEAAGYSFLSASQKEEICVVMQCRKKSQLCVASYNTEIDQVVCFIRIPLEKIEKIEIGSLGKILRTSKRVCMRIYYSLLGDKLCYFTLKTVNFTSIDEDKAILLSIAGAISYPHTTIIRQQKLSRKRSPPHKGIIYLVVPEEWVKGWDEVDSMKEQENDVSVADECSCTGSSERRMTSRLHDTEHSHSDPSTPSLSAPYELSRFFSHSVDDISYVNNGTASSHPVSLTLNSTQQAPAACFRPFESGESGSESELEVVHLSKNVHQSPSSRLCVQNQFVENMDKHSEKVESGDDEKLRTTASNEVLASGEESDSSSDYKNRSLRSHVTQKLMAVGKQLTVNSPGLLRRIATKARSKSPQNLPSL